MSMPLLGVNVVSIKASILMSSYTSKNNKDTSRRTDCAQSLNSLHWEELGLRCSSVWQHACVQPLVRWHGQSQVFKITRRTPLSPNSIFGATKWETLAPLH